MYQSQNKRTPPPKKKILKGGREKIQIIFKGIKIRLRANVLK